MSGGGDNVKMISNKLSNIHNVLMQIFTLINMPQKGLLLQLNKVVYLSLGGINVDADRDNSDI